MQVDTPSNWIVEFFATLVQDLDRLGVRHVHKWLIEHQLQGCQQTGLDSLLKEIHILSTVLQRLGDHELEIALGELHVVDKFKKRSLWLDHPKLRQVPRSIRVFRAERRPKGIDFSERARIRFAFQLAADGQVR